MRGIIITPEYDGDEKSLSVKGGINPVKLRQYLLYWDKIDLPDNIILKITSPELDYLEKANILKRTHYNGFKSGLVGVNIYIDTQMYAFNKDNNAKDEIWSLAQPTKKLILPSEESIKTRTLQVDLYNSIPVPTADVNLEDILAFKERRNDELQEFRCLMDDMYSSIINSLDKDMAKDSSILRLQNKLIELNKVMNESKIERFLGNVKVELDISGLAKSGLLNTIGGYALGTKIGFPTAGAIVGFASSLIKITAESSLKPKKLPENLTDYAYLYYQNKELR